jgi:hypothetical protein
VTGARAGARKLGGRRRARLPWLCACAAVLACTDPRARPAPPAVQVLVADRAVPSPGFIAASIVAHDVDGMDSLHVAVRSPDPRLAGDSLYLVPDTADVTLNVVWTVPDSLPTGTRITLLARAWNLIGFAGSDSVILTSQ